MGLVKLILKQKGFCMGDEICWLFSILCDNQLFTCALKCKRKYLVGDVETCPMEPENRQFLKSLLPQHIQELGPIVNVEKIFEVHIYQE